MIVSGTVRTLSWIFGFLIGGMWIGEILLGNLGGTSVFGNLREFHPRIYAMAPWFALAAVAGCLTGSMAAALRVGIWSGLIGGAIVGVIGMGITVLFHDAMMTDPSNIHEFARSARRPPNQAELSAFLYWDALGGWLNHLWIGPVLGVTIGGIGAALGKSMKH